MRLLALALFFAAKANATLLMNCPLQGSVCTELEMQGTVPTLTFGSYKCYGPFTDGPQAFKGSAAFDTNISLLANWSFQAWANIGYNQAAWVIFNPVYVAVNNYLVFDPSANFIRWAVGASNLDTPANSVYAGCQYQIKITWDGTTRKIFLNGVERASTTSGSGTLGAVTASWFGRFNGAGFPGNVSYLRDVSFSDSSSETMPSSSAIQVTNNFLIATHGHSIVYGASCGGVPTDAFRTIISDRLTTAHGISSGFVGNRTASTDTDGVGGYLVAQVDARMTDKLRWSIPNPSTATAVVIMSLTNDASAAATSLASVSTSVNSIISQIHTYSPLIPVFWLTDILRQDAYDIGTYNAVARNQVRIWRGLGKRNVFVIEGESLAAGTCDNVHPTTITNQRIGQLVADEIARQYIYPVSKDNGLVEAGGE